MRAAVTKESDPAGYAQLRKRWLALTASANANARVLTNAAWFFALPERHPNHPGGPQEITVAEGLLLRALGQPDNRRPADFYSGAGDGVNRSMLTRRLSELYLSALAPLAGRAEDPALAAWAKQRLDQSADAEVLLITGTELVYRRPQAPELGRRYIERAGRVEGGYAAPRARERLRQIDQRGEGFPLRPGAAFRMACNRREIKRRPQASPTREDRCQRVQHGRVLRLACETTGWQRQRFDRSRE
jgi:hypothetical protein